MRLYASFFQPVMKLKHKTRHGAKVHKVYDAARTPYQRVLERCVLTTQQRDALARHHQRLNPVRLLAQITQALDHLWTLAQHPTPKDFSVTLLFEATNALR